MITRRHRALALWAAIWVLPSLTLLALTEATVHRYRVPAPAMLELADARVVLAHLRAALDRRRHDLAEIAELPLPGPMVARVYVRGAAVATVVVTHETLKAATAATAEALWQQPAIERLGAERRAEARIELHLLSAPGPVLTSPALLAALSVHPGVEGIGRRFGESVAVLLPQDLVDKRLLLSEKPLAFIPDFRFGFDRNRAERELGALARRTGLDAEPSGSLFRFRARSFVEGPPSRDGVRQAIALTPEGLVPGPTLSAKSLRDGAVLGGRYLARHLADNGRFEYQVDLSTGHRSNPHAPGPYSLPRHAGTTYFLAELYRHTREEFLVEPMERAMAHLAELSQAGACQGTTTTGRRFACVVDAGSPSAELGSTALAVVALVEHRRATGSTRFAELSLELGEFLLLMQREDGSFRHRYDVALGRANEEVELLYYSGEAALALVRLHEVTSDPRYLRAAELALDWLVDWYDFFVGGYFYGEEHWTCIAAGAASKVLDRREYLEFCRGYGAFLRRHQPLPGDIAGQPFWAGSYYFTPFVPPQNTPAGSRTEAMISTYELGLAHGTEDPQIWAQIQAAMAYALHQQFREDSLYRVPLGARGLGAIPAGPTDRVVRIDYVQHVCSAMIRLAALLQARGQASDDRIGP